MFAGYSLLEMTFVAIQNFSKIEHNFFALSQSLEEGQKSYCGSPFWKQGKTSLNLRAGLSISKVGFHLVRQSYSSFFLEIWSYSAILANNNNLLFGRLKSSTLSLMLLTISMISKKAILKRFKMYA